MVYLIHFDKPFKHALHYLGFSQDDKYEQRIECHRKNKGSRLLAAVNKAGIGWKVVRTWPNADGNFERKLKSGHSSRYCPICNKDKSHTHGLQVETSTTDR